MTSPLRDDETMNVAILLFDGVEELDFCGPYEVFQAASSQAADVHENGHHPFTVFTVAEKDQLIRASFGIRVQPDYTFDTAPRIDLLIVPGGNTAPQLENQPLLDWLARATSQARINSSVCTGAFLLGKLGLLDGHAATTHWSTVERLAARHPNVNVKADVRWVDEGTIITSAGISAGIDMSLHLVERLLGRAIAEAAARYMEYQWHENA